MKYPQCKTCRFSVRSDTGQIECTSLHCTVCLVGDEYSPWDLHNLSSKEQEYIRYDLMTATTLSAGAQYRLAHKRVVPDIDKVVFNDPATIVFWKDGTKTVVKCQGGDQFDPEKGLAMAISKKALGNKGNYCNVIKKWTEKYAADMAFSLKDALERAANKINAACEALRGVKK